MSYSVLLPSVRGQFMVYRSDRYHAHHLMRTGVPHIEAEVQTLLQICQFIRGDAIVIDAGASVGLIAVPIAQRLANSGGKVIAFEPQRYAFYMLAGNAALSGLTNLECNRVALGDVEGEVSVPLLNPYAEADFGAVSLLGPCEKESDIVPIATVDGLMLDHVDLMKIDVERMELSVLKGATRTIERHRPMLWIEIWPDMYSQVCPWLTEIGYCLFAFDSLNFFGVPKELSGEIPIALPRFDGIRNPFCT